MAAAKEHHTALWLAAAGGAAVAGYELFYKPWKTSHDLAAATGLSPLFPTGGLTSPSSIGPAPASTQQQGSIVDPRNSPGGDVGQVMWKKNWTQQQATDRLNAIKQGIANSRAAIATLQSGVGTANPAAAGINQAQAQLAAETAALASAKVAYDQLVAAGNTAGAAQYSAAIAGHQNDINELNARIAAASQPVNTTGAVAAYQGTLASLLADYTALTGATYGG